MNLLTQEIDWGLSSSPTPLLIGRTVFWINFSPKKGFKKLFEVLTVITDSHLARLSNWKYFGRYRQYFPQLHRFQMALGNLTFSQDTLRHLLRYKCPPIKRMQIVVCGGSNQNLPLPRIRIRKNRKGLLYSGYCERINSKWRIRLLSKSFLSELEEQFS